MKVPFYTNPKTIQKHTLLVALDDQNLNRLNDSIKKAKVTDAPKDDE